jgi:DNA-binding response OmpR family regulator
MISKQKILIAEDDDSIAELLRLAVERGGFAAENAYSGTEALRLFEGAEEPYSLLILDLMLPGLGGAEVLAKVREKSDIPVMILSARADKESRLGLIESGADDYMTKPFDIDELLVRISALLRRATKPTAQACHPGLRPGASNAPQTSAEPPNTQTDTTTLTHKDLTLDPIAHEVTAAGHPINLTAGEYDILHLLMSHPRKAFTRENIAMSLWGEEAAGRGIDVHISNIRTKLAKCSKEKHIKTIWGTGFRMED